MYTARRRRTRTSVAAGCTVSRAPGCRGNWDLERSRPHSLCAHVRNEILANCPCPCPPCGFRVRVVVALTCNVGGSSGSVTSCTSTDVGTLDTCYSCTNTVSGVSAVTASGCSSTLTTGAAACSVIKAACTSNYKSCTSNNCNSCSPASVLQVSAAFILSVVAAMLF